MLLANLMLALAALGGTQAGEPFDRGVDAYRRGDFAEASVFWRSCLDDELAARDRARVAYNLGNAAWRGGDALEAVGWYTIALRGDPRSADVWHNLELVRAEAELEPADRGDLRATWNRLVTSVTPAESRVLVLLALLPLALALLGEALRGGKLWRMAALGCLALAALFAVPWMGHLLADGGETVLVVRTSPVALRSEPRRDLEPVGQLDPGAAAVRIDALPGWVRVETEDGVRGWLQEEAIFSLTP